MKTPLVDKVNREWCVGLDKKLHQRREAIKAEGFDPRLTPLKAALEIWCETGGSYYVAFAVFSARVYAEAKGVKKTHGFIQQAKKIERRYA